MKRIITLLTLVAITALLRPLMHSEETVYKYNSILYSVIDETARTCKVAGSDRTLRTLAIPPYIEGYKVTEIGPNAFKDQTLLNSVSIPDSIEIIGDYAFYNCCNLLYYEFPKCLKRIGEYAFAGTTKSSITFPAGLKDIGNGAFASLYNTHFRTNTPGIISLTIPTGLENMGINVFNLTNIPFQVYGPVIAEPGNFFEGSGKPILGGPVDVYYNNPNPRQFAEGSFTFDFPYPNTNINLHVPAEAVEKCKTIRPWCQFPNISAIPVKDEPTGEQPYVPATRRVFLEHQNYLYYIDPKMDYCCVYGTKNNTDTINIGSTLNYDNHNYTILDAGCMNLSKSQTIKLVNIHDVNSVSAGAFQNFKATDVGVHNVVTIGESSFNSTNFGNLTLNNVSKIGTKAFSYITAKNVRLINVSDLGNNAFYYANIDTLTIYHPGISSAISRSNTKLCGTNIAKYASINTFIIHGIDTIPNSAFLGTAIDNLFISEGTKVIGANAFETGYNPSIESIHIPASVEQIGAQAFKVYTHPSNIPAVYYYATDPKEFDSDVITNPQGAILYVPTEAVDKCKQTTPWCNFKDILPIELTD